LTNEATLFQTQAPGRTENFYRKWRPIAFAELYGQEHVARTLTNALASGRTAHAYLLTGPRGTGKTTTGRLYAKALNCTHRRDGEPCNECESCVAYLGGRAMDLVELDAASNRGIDEIRGIRDKVAFAPGAGQYKVYLIDEVHMLTDAAFNALLKTLEEPPPHAVFMLATTEAHKVPATVLSRCQRFDFRRAPLASLVANLERICAGEGITVEPAALELIARSATGSHRDAVNVLDQLATSYGHELTLEHIRTGLGLIGDERSGRLARLALAGDLGGGLSLIASVRDDGLDLRQFQRELVSELRALLMAKSGLSPEDGATIERQRELQQAVQEVPTSRLLVALRSFGEADLKQDPNSTLPLDIALANTALGSEASVTPQPQGAIGQSGNRTNGAPPAQPPRVADVVPPVRDSLAPLKNDPAPANWGASPQPRPTASESRTVPEALEGPGAEPSTSSEQVETPATAPAPQSTSPSPPTLAAARAQMRAIYEASRARLVPLGALINSGCDIIAADETTVTLGLKFPFHVQNIEKHLPVLNEVVSSALGRTVTVRAVHDANVEDWKLRETASRSPLVRAAQEMGARVLSPEPEE
jgi:DNA polymerase-3 subunit gamma/tau